MCDSDCLWKKDFDTLIYPAAVRIEQEHLENKNTEEECTSFDNLCDAVKLFGMIASPCRDKPLAK